MLQRISPIQRQPASCLALGDRIDSVDLSDGQALVITDGVLLAVANALARSYKPEAIQIIEDFLSAEDVEAVHFTPDFFNQSFELYKTHQDKSWGLVDCASFVIIWNQDIHTALTFDRHSIQAGFQVFLTH